MRRTLVESARRKKRIKHGSTRQRAELEDYPAPSADGELIALDEAMQRLAAEDPIAARVMELRRFAGLGHKQVADALGITVYQARQQWPRLLRLVLPSDGLLAAGRKGKGAAMVRTGRAVDGQEHAR